MSPFPSLAQPQNLHILEAYPQRKLSSLASSVPAKNEHEYSPGKHLTDSQPIIGASVVDPHPNAVPDSTCHPDVHLDADPDSDPDF